MAISSSFEAIMQLSHAMSFLQLQAIVGGVDESSKAYSDAKEAASLLLDWGQLSAIQGVMEGIEAMSFPFSKEDDYEVHSHGLQALFAKVMESDIDLALGVDPEQVSQLEALFQAS